MVSLSPSPRSSLPAHHYAGNCSTFKVPAHHQMLQRYKNHASAVILDSHLWVKGLGVYRVCVVQPAVVPRRICRRSRIGMRDSVVHKLRTLRLQAGEEMRRREQVLRVLGVLRTLQPRHRIQIQMKIRLGMLIVKFF